MPKCGQWAALGRASCEIFIEGVITIGGTERCRRRRRQPPVNHTGAPPPAGPDCRIVNGTRRYKLYTGQMLTLVIPPADSVAIKLDKPEAGGDNIR